ncbi:MAG TPA: class I SAM-dependent methyltransferase [Solirubrobacteraceae bacterium]|jgi:SAM-dependent methyltransferase|nr:class I SAM-dependent methyltransferase [Solirubrobacteraceae bacterium]
MSDTTTARWLRRLAAYSAQRLSAVAGAPVNGASPADPAGNGPGAGQSAGSAPQPPPIVPEPGAPARFARELEPVRAGDEDQIASLRLLARLSEDDIREVEAAIARDEQLQAYYAGASDSRHRTFMLLSFGVWLSVPAVLDKLGLGAGQPPEEVHAMARGPLAAAGGLYEADMVAAALHSVGVPIEGMDAALDFGCSSGRLVRVLAAAYPQVRWHGCDPNGPAIEWARSAYPDINIFSSSNSPPLDLPDGSLELICAISIWSHFAPALGLRWFDEMRRLLRPGGHLVFTTHGFTAVDFYVRNVLRTVPQSDEIVGGLYKRGWWYAQEFGAQGDWGVINPDWGTAFLSPEWLLAQLCPAWRVLQFEPGRNQDNQDVYVLQRV